MPLSFLSLVFKKLWSCFSGDCLTRTSYVMFGRSKPEQ